MGTDSPCGHGLRVRKMTAGSKGGGGVFEGCILGNSGRPINPINALMEKLLWRVADWAASGS
jgi:hypothetical protein